MKKNTSIKHLRGASIFLALLFAGIIASAHQLRAADDLESRAHDTSDMTAQPAGDQDDYGQYDNGNYDQSYNRDDQACNQPPAAQQQRYGRNDQMGRADQMARPQALSPRIRLFNTPKEYLIRVEAPGFRKDDVKVSLENGMLMVSGQRQENDEEKEAHYQEATEGVYKSFYRSIRVPADADSTKVHAVMKEGILWVRIGRNANPENVGVQ